MNIIVASENPVKIASVEQGFVRMFPDEELTITGVSVDSGVADQPIGDTETLQGAVTRAQNAKHAKPNADYWVGLEGGIADTDGEMSSFAWIVVISKENGVGKGKTGTFFLPKQVADLVRAGTELGHAMDEVFGTQNSKHSSGATGLLTHGVLERTEFYTQAVILALIPHKNQNMPF
ncbi:MAG: inosine/xanthosine triphosphatase [Candidatus Andersenbacteria bacterium]